MDTLDSNHTVRQTFPTNITLLRQTSLTNITPVRRTFLSVEQSPTSISHRGTISPRISRAEKLMGLRIDLDSVHAAKIVVDALVEPD